jgi:lysophospholipase L1-like esterase
VLNHNPDLVFIEFAINDAHVKFNMPVERGASNLDAMVKAIRNQNPEAAIILQTMSSPWDAPNGNRSFSDRPLLEAFYDNYRTYAQKQDLLLIDNNPDWQKIKETDPDKYHRLLADGLHPNGEGYAAVTWPNLKSVLEQWRESK